MTTLEDIKQLAKELKAARLHHDQCSAERDAADRVYSSAYAAMFNKQQEWGAAINKYVSEVTPDE